MGNERSGCAAVGGGFLFMVAMGFVVGPFAIVGFFVGFGLLSDLLLGWAGYFGGLVVVALVLAGSAIAGIVSRRRACP